jgi:FixJ family two-component response regulator
MNETAKTVYIVDDEPGMRKALTRLLRAEGFEVHSFASAGAFLGAHGVEENACLVLDVSMPDLDGLALQERLAQANLALPIIFLSGKGDIPTSVRAIKAGAVDFLTKPANDSDLLRAIRAGLALAASRREERARYHSLTPREREVMAHVVAGDLNKQIAAKLGTGEQNIKIHRGRVMLKMKVTSLPELVRAAERLGVRSAGDHLTNV